MSYCQAFNIDAAMPGLPKNDAVTASASAINVKNVFISMLLFRLLTIIVIAT
jgi:hypothetical protein